MRKRYLFCLLLIVAGALGRVRHAQPPAGAPTTTPAESAAGVKLTFHADAQLGRAVDARVARLIALAVPDGSSPSPALGPGRFRATFDGVVTLETSYEQLAADLTAGVSKVLAFLGVDVVGLQPQSYKTGRKDVRKEIANWEELAAAFADTRWRHLFDRT